MLTNVGYIQKMNQILQVLFFLACEYILLFYKLKRHINWTQCCKTNKLHVSWPGFPAFSTELRRVPGIQWGLKYNILTPSQNWHKSYSSERSSLPKSISHCSFVKKSFRDQQSKYFMGVITKKKGQLQITGGVEETVAI